MGQTGAWWGGGVGRRGGVVVHVAAVRGGWDGAHVLVEVAVARVFRLGDWGFFAGSCGSWVLGLMEGNECWRWGWEGSWWGWVA